ncbi:MAG: helix-turn-helix domain-containing protein [Marinobacter sp.]|nr:helix-turn-helix domain-containing protein [Marinobacter sp.]
MTQQKRIWLGADRALFIGELPATRQHTHAAPVLLIGLSGPLRMQFPDGQQETCHSALIDAGVEHALDSRGETMATLYLEPDAPETRLLRSGVLKHQAVAFDVLPSPSRHKRLEGQLQSFELAPLLGRSALGPITSMDERITRSLAQLRQCGDKPLGRASLAQLANLSESRFNHLFRSEMGISFRRYRSWSRLRSALYHVASNPSLTSAALAAGLHDSAHFSRLFQDMIGLPPSSVLSSATGVEILKP